LHVTWVEDEIDAAKGLDADATTTFFVTVHPFVSVTVTEYVPAANPVAVEPVPPEGDQEYVYGDVPPEADTVALPFDEAPVAEVEEVVAASTVGSDRTIVFVAGHPKLSRAEIT
jgi:hypothetical protein